MPKCQRAGWMLKVLLTCGVLISSTPRCAAQNGDVPFWNSQSRLAAFEKIQNQHMARARETLSRLLAVNGRRTVENTLAPYDEAYLHFDNAYSQCSLIGQVHPEASFRKAAADIKKKAAEFETELLVNHRVYEALKAIDLTRADSETNYYVARLLRDFRLAGVDRDEPTRRRITVLQNELEAIKQEFSRNINSDSRSITAGEAELDGLPSDFIARYRKGSDGKISIPIDLSTTNPIRLYAKNDEIRKRVYFEHYNQGYSKNMSVLDRMLKKRYDLANTLGFATWADYITVDKMVKSAKNASRFLTTLANVSAEPARREFQRILQCKRTEKPGAETINPWEISYWSEKLKQQELSFDSQQVRAYFPYLRIKQGIMALMGRLFGVTFRQIKGVEVWHPSVECWEMLQGEQLLGRFYLDMHPRPDKFSLGAYFNIRAGVAGHQIPEGALVCNFPGGIEGDPGLMEHEDVRHFLHEFGHLLHYMFAGRQRWLGTGTLGVESDFREAPSQMLEEWLWDAPTLEALAKHYQTGESIPTSLLVQMKRASEFGKALATRHQIAIAEAALEYHGHDPANLDSDLVMRKAMERYLPFPFVDGTHYQCSYTHLTSQSALVYKYLWSQVIAKDMFSRFRVQNLSLTKTAKEYCDQVLVPGGSMPAETLVRNFLGRPFDSAAWESWLDDGGSVGKSCQDGRR